MNVFIDTSSLIKLYHYETGSHELDQFLVQNTITAIMLSEITKTEFESALWKKIRTNELKQDEGQQVIEYFRADYPKFHFIEVSRELVARSRELISKYGIEGLRTLDALQLASMLTIKSTLGKVVTADENLKTFVKKEDLPLL